MIGDRIRLARDFEGLTQTELAARLGIQQSTLAYLESGRHRPSPPIITALARVTDFPAPFFCDVPLDAFPQGSLAFRRRKQTSAAEVTRAYTVARLGWELTIRMLHRVKRWPIRVPIMNEEEPEAAAAVTRSALGASPDEPLGHLLGKIESLGVAVFEIDRDLHDLDGFSLWAGLPTPRPVVVVNAATPGDRQRWTLAHELGHLVLHGAIRGRVDEVEADADAFAAELLLPESVMRNEFVAPVTLSHVAELKARWGVSMAGLIRRAHDLGIITDRRKKDLFIQLGKHGWRTAEPVPIARERSQTLEQLSRAIYGASATAEGVLTQEGFPRSLAAALIMESPRLRIVR